MLDDTDFWPVPCPKCGQVTQEKIGDLKHGVRVTCHGCGAHLWYHVETFLDALEKAKRAFGSVTWRVGKPDKDT